MPVIKDFRIVDDFYLWEAYQGINNGRTIDQFRIVDNFYLYQVVLNFFGTIIGLLSWKDAGTFDYTDWQPNALSIGSIPFVLNIGSKEIITDVMININIPFAGGAATNVTLNIDNSSFVGSGLTSGFILFSSPPTSVYQSTAVENFDSNNYNMNGRLRVFGDVIDNLTAGEIQVFYKTTFQP